MRVFIRLIFLIVVITAFESCNGHREASSDGTMSKPSQPGDLKVGGIYLIQNKDSTYYVTKILVIDDDAVHLRTYSDTFKTKPSGIISANLKILIGHAPLDKHGFLTDNPELLKIENVTDSELEGYKMYIEAMSK